MIRLRGLGWGTLWVGSVAAWVALSDPAAGYDFRKQRLRVPYSGEQELAVDIDLSSGAVQIAAGDSATLCAVDIAYDAHSVSPQVDTLAREGALERVLIRAREHASETSLFGPQSAEQTAYTIRLSPLPRLLLSVRLKEIQCALRLGGLTVSDLDLELDGGSAELTFDAPNRISIRRLSVDASGTFTATGLGRAGIESLDFSGGTGKFHLGFAGDMVRRLRARVAINLGSLVLEVPTEVGVLVRPPGGLLVGFQAPEDFRERSDGAYVNAAWDADDERLEIVIEARAGVIEVRTIEDE